MIVKLENMPKKRESRGCRARIVSSSMRNIIAKIENFLPIPIRVAVARTCESEIWNQWCHMSARKEWGLPKTRYDIIEKFQNVENTYCATEYRMKEATAGLNWFRMSKLWSFPRVNQHIVNKFIQMKWWVKWFHTLCTFAFHVCLNVAREIRQIIFRCFIELSTPSSWQMYTQGYIQIWWNFLSISLFLISYISSNLIPLGCGEGCYDVLIAKYLTTENIDGLQTQSITANTNLGKLKKYFMNWVELQFQLKVYHSTADSIKWWRLQTNFIRWQRRACDRMRFKLWKIHITNK